MTTFVQRCTGDCGDESDGTQLNMDHVRAVFALIVLGQGSSVIPLAKSSWALSAGQQDEFDEIVATKPSGVIEAAAWAQRVISVFVLGTQHWTGFDDSNACRVAMGLASLE